MLYCNLQKVISVSLALSCLLLMNSVKAEETYQNKFALINKTYIRDLEPAFNLYISVEKHYKGNEPFYIVTPQDDQKAFMKFFSEAKKEKKIQKLPIFLTDEYVLSKCDLGIKNPVITKVQGVPVDTFSCPGGQCNIMISDGEPDTHNRQGIVYDDFTRKYVNYTDLTNARHNLFLIGWTEQQLIKLCLAKTNIAQHYVTFDSDLRSVRDFDKNLFYDQETGILRTVYNPYRIQEKFPINRIFKYLKIKDQKEKIFGISSYAIYNSDMLKNLLQYVSTLNKGQLSTFYDLITYAEWEMQWQAQYIYSFHRDKFKPMPMIEVILDPIVRNPQSMQQTGNQIRLCKTLAMITNTEEYKNRYLEAVQSTNGFDVSTIEGVIDVFCSKGINKSFYDLFNSYYQWKQKRTHYPLTNICILAQ